MSRTVRSTDGKCWKRWGPKPGRGRWMKRRYWKAVRSGRERSISYARSELARKGH